MSASAAPMMQSVGAAPAQYVIASPAGYSATQGAAVPMEPVAGQPMPQMTYTGASMGASAAFQAGGQVTYGAPQVISQGYSVSAAQPGQEVTYLSQPGQEVQTAPAQYITAAPQYVTPAQPAQVVQQPGGAVTYAAPTVQSYTVAQGATTQYAAQGATTQYVLPSAPSMVAYPGAPSTYFPMNVQAAWDNHFSAFGAKDVDRILLDYDETSVIRVFTSTTNQLTEFRGTMQIRQFFSGVFQELIDMSTLDAPVQLVEEEYKQVFLVWKCPSSGVTLATDTFIFGPDNKIKRQNIVMDKKAGFVAQAINSVSSGRMGNAASPMGVAAAGAMGAGAMAPGSGISSAKASKKKDKKDSKKKLSSKKKAKGGFC